MTEKDPDHRPANGAALLEDLRHIRQTLSAAELDVGAAPGGLKVPAGRALAAPTAQANTEVIGGPSFSPDATSVIAAPHFPTSVLPASPRLYTDDVDTAAADASEDAVGPLTKRQASAAAKVRAKAAATPTKTLGTKKPKRRALLWILLVGILAVLAATAGWFVGFGPGALATVPDVHNKTVPQAQEMLLAAGFEQVPTADIFDEKVAAGFIVSTNPEAGSSVRKFNAITLQVSRGPVLYAVPTLTGQQLEAARKALVDAHLTEGNVSEAFDEKVPAGVVLGQDPAAGKEFRAGTKVNFSVSKGPKPIPVPSVAGKTEADALAALKAVGLVGAVAPEQVNSRTVPAGSVVSQAPDSGNLTAGGNVTLTLSKGPKMIAVPSMVGKQVGAATAELKALGFEVKVENLLGGFFGTVRFQSPEGGEAAEGSTIILRVV
ncbi:Stk1 family PASTA domain-containing Ser/Thr kinase [Arthrobacter alpinus]|uniref:Stk1 family PASTA domain-containing Ser/Thr kinase n=1 Tax=Arthrobacter alpinus TaxID=656366 RepID=UPI00313A0C7B